MSEEIFHRISGLLSQGKRLALASVIEAQGSAPRGTSAKMIITEDGATYGTVGGGCAEAYVVQQAKKVISDGVLRIFELDLGDDSWSGIGMACGGVIKVSLELIAPKPRLIILGAGHVARSIANLAHLTNFKVAVIDSFAERDKFPEADEVIQEEVGKGASNLKITPNDYVVIITRHHQDERALRSVINSTAAYIGMIGSKNRVRLVYETLVKEGVPADQLLKVNAPIGLDIGAESPEEIAVSVIAEIIKTSKGGTGQSMAIRNLAHALPQKTK